MNLPKIRITANYVILVLLTLEIGQVSGQSSKKEARKIEPQSKRLMISQARLTKLESAYDSILVALGPLNISCSDHHSLQVPGGDVVFVPRDVVCELRSVNKTSAITVVLDSRKHTLATCECSKDPHSANSPEQRVFCGCPTATDRMGKKWNVGTDDLNVSKLPLSARGQPGADLVDATESSDRVLIPLQNATVKDHFRGSEKTYSLSAGDVLPLKQGKHHISNLSKEGITFILVEFAS